MLFVCLFVCLFCFVLFCFVLFCFVLFCFVLFCFVLFCFVLFCFVLFCFVLFCFVLFVCLFVCWKLVDFAIFNHSRFAVLQAQNANCSISQQMNERRKNERNKPDSVGQVCCSRGRVSAETKKKKIR